MLVFFLKISAVTYTTECARAYGFVFERHQRSDFFVEKLYGMRARALASACACPRGARGRPRRLGCSLGVLGGSAAKWTNVVWPIKSRPTDKQINTHYSFIGVDEPGGICILPISLHHHRLQIVSFLCLTAHLANPPLAPYE